MVALIDQHTIATLIQFRNSNFMPYQNNRSPSGSCSSSDKGSNETKQETFLACYEYCLSSCIPHNQHCEQYTLYSCLLGLKL